MREDVARIVYMRTEVKIAELKAGLSRYLRSVQKGNEVVIKDRETPIARLVPYQPGRPRLASTPPTRALKDLDKLPVRAPAGLTVDEVDEALREERRERLDDILR
jgi:prevent-host-death family protein